MFDLIIAMFDHQDKINRIVKQWFQQYNQTNYAI